PARRSGRASPPLGGLCTLSFPSLPSQTNEGSCLPRSPNRRLQQVFPLGAISSSSPSPLPLRDAGRVWLASSPRQRAQGRVWPQRRETPRLRHPVGSP